MARIFNKSDFLAAKLPTVEVPVPEMGQDAVALLQQWSVTTRALYWERNRLYHEALDAYEADQELPEEQREGVGKPEDLDLGDLTLALSIVSEQGELLFGADDLSVFKSWPHTAVRRMYEAALDLNQYERTISQAVALEKKG